MKNDHIIYEDEDRTTQDKRTGCNSYIIVQYSYGVNSEPKNSIGDKLKIRESIF